MCVAGFHAGRTVDDQIRDLVHYFITKGLMVKADRKYKKPKPGKKRLVKFPRTLHLCQVWRLMGRGPRYAQQLERDQFM